MLHSIFHPRSHTHDVLGPSVRTAVRIMSEAPAQQLEAFGYFAPDAPLRERRLIVCQPPNSWSTRAPLEHYVFFLEPGVLLALLGHTRRSQDAIVSWPKDALDAEVSEVPAEIGEELRDILARFLAEKGPGPVPSSPAPDEAPPATPSVAPPSTAQAEAATPNETETDDEDVALLASGNALAPLGPARFATGLICHLDLAQRPEEATWRQRTSRLHRWAAQLAQAIQRPLVHIHLASLLQASPAAPQTSTAPGHQAELLREKLRDAQLQDAAVLLEADGLLAPPPSHTPPLHESDAVDESDAAHSDDDHGTDHGIDRASHASLAASPGLGSAGGVAFGDRDQVAAACREALRGFAGLLLVDHSELLPFDEGEKRPILRLSREAEGRVQLTQLQGPPIRKRAERHGLKGLEQHLSQRVVGQEKALHRLAEVLRIRKAQVDANPRRPDGVFLLAGPSGVGKTETAKALNEALFGQADALVRLDMSEFHFRESISGLIGTTPGWVGYEKGGRLTNAIQKNPEAVVLLDEIEKAHPQVLDVFLQVFDDGRLTDGKGQTVDMSRATFLMTSNIGADLFAHDQRLGFVKEVSRDALASDLRRALRKHLRPEFINRIDEILVYHPLTTEHMREICHRALRALQIRFARKGIWLAIDEAIIAHITAQATPEDGARSLQRHIEQQLAQPLAAQMLRRPHATRLALHLREGTIIVEEIPS